ncbi:uncharacterized protein Pyn_02890 [Prunus yedoensis var. nudiflora]|uniref:GRF-type domain-containing protein n=1 Tax=Prunus yedoensis var. nudiflora TaxID=2094558 RepID=A0A314U8Q7_PRUYE|nr:uncharacterized protein Pyn_02890 [Prunus yedoensis var. nudiflora]
MKREIIDGGEELDVAAPRCYFGKIACLQTSWTEANPLRRFHVCPNSSGRRKKGCGFFVWVDVEFPPREKALVSCLLRRLKELEKDIGRRQSRERKLMGWLILSWVMFLLVWHFL